MSDQPIPERDETAPEPEGYDAWFREEVEIGLAEANDPETVWMTLEESDEHLRLLRARRDGQQFAKAS